MLYTNATFHLKKPESEAEIHARLRELARGMRELRKEVRRQSCPTGAGTEAVRRGAQAAFGTGAEEAVSEPTAPGVRPGDTGWTVADA